MRRAKPFIRSRDRIDLVASLAREYHESVAVRVQDLIERALDDDDIKNDGKWGAAEGGAERMWGDKKDGKEGKEDKGKDAKEKDKDKDKDGKEDKEKEKESSDKGKDKDKDGKEGGDKGKEGKEKEKENSKEGKEKEKETDDGKYGGSERFDPAEFRFAEELVLPADAFEHVAREHAVRIETLLKTQII